MCFASAVMGCRLCWRSLEPGTKKYNEKNIENKFIHVKHNCSAKTRKTNVNNDIMHALHGKWAHK